ncbi:MAG: hypothetical protein R6V46_17370 [Desulfatiglandaceae bacterium]
MKVSESLKVIDAGWVRKPKGFRVHFQKMVGSELITDYVPGEDEAPLDSDVVAWRLAWKLAQATASDGTEAEANELVNIYVVDDMGHPVKFYGTNEGKVYNEGTK